jgi:hypothetical protein
LKSPEVWKRRDRHRSNNDRFVLVRGVLTTRARECGSYDAKEAALTWAEPLGHALDGVDDPVIALAFLHEFIRRREAD